MVSRLAQISVIFWSALSLNIADIFLKNSQKILSVPFATAAVIYLAVLYPAWWVLRQADFAMVLWTWAAIAVVIAAATSVLYYHEPMTIRRVLACAAALLAILLEK